MRIACLNYEVMKYSVNFDIELKKNPYSGMYIALEGIDGSGKTTQVEKLADYYRSLGKEVFLTHEPRRDGAMGDLINSVLQGKIKIPSVAIQYLFAAQRAAHLEDALIPALQRGAVVISDRCFWSSIPYGLLDRYELTKEEAPDQLLTALSILSMYHEFIAPDVTFLLDVEVETAGERFKNLGRAAEIYEKKDKLIKIKEGYSFLLEKFPGVFTTIHAEQEIQKVTDELLSALKKLSK